MQKKKKIVKLKLDILNRPAVEKRETMLNNPFFYIRAVLKSACR